MKRQMKRLLLLLYCASTLSGCAFIQAEPWPDDGTGGLAEWTPIGDERASALSARIDVLKERNAAYLAASDLVEAQTLLTRVRRELAGQLYIDADKDMDALESIVLTMEHRMSGKRQPKERARA